tara:strand:+ start:476 stop:907 length:432 start_codon:yes stop_codon:yes gene_type:complete
MAKAKLVKDRRGRTGAVTVNAMASKTVQADQDKADIRMILRKYEQVGIVDQLNAGEAQFVDVSELGDYVDVMNVVREAEATFMKLPSKTREIFGHDVANWLDYCHDKDKRDELVEAGVIDSVTDSSEEAPGAEGDSAAAEGSE